MLDQEQQGVTVTWKSISEVELWDELNTAEDRMTLSQRRFWEAIRIIPEKWRQSPWGDKGDGFWVVAIIGRNVVWYNDIEEGFNRSVYRAYGEIEEYWCNQDELEVSIQRLIDMVETGVDSAPRAGPPEPLNE